MYDVNAFERQVADEAVRMAGPSERVDDVAIFAAVTAAQTAWRVQPVFGALKLALAAAAVTVFGSILLAGVLTRPTRDGIPAVGASATPAATTSIQPVELPTEIPEGVESGPLGTPLGPARWVHLRGDATTLPSGLSPVPVPSGGYVTLDAPEGAPPRLWRSPDLIDWVAEPLPMAISASFANVARADDALWLKTSEPTALWRSVDSRAWTEVSLDRLPAPAPAGPWRSELGDPLTSDGVTIVPITHSPDHVLILTELGGYCCTDGEDGVYRLSSDRGEHLASVRFEDAGSGLRVIDAEDGTELARLEGMSIGFIERLASDLGIEPVHGLGVVIGHELIDVDLPRTLSEQPQVEFVIDDAGFAAYGFGQDALVHVYRSEDGRDWVETHVVGDDPGEPAEIVDIYRHPRQASVVIESEPHITEWTSSDGTAWESWHPPDEFGGAPFASGGIMLQLRFEMHPWPGWEMEADTLWYAPESGAPVAIDLSVLGMADLNGLAAKAVPISSNTLAIGADHQGAGPRDIWIITFDALAA